MFIGIAHNLGNFASHFLIGMLKRILTHLLVILYFYPVSLAQETEIYGLLPDYAGSEFVFETFADYVSHETISLGKVVVSNDGSFSLKIPLQNTITIFVKAGVYKGFLILQPGKRYNILLPDRVEKSKSEKLNPFFSEMKVYLYPQNSDSTELNFRRRHVSKYINSFLSRNINSIAVGRINRHIVDSFIISINEKFPVDHSDKFYPYLQYMIGHLKSITYLRSMNNIAKQFFLDRPILYSNEDYMFLFNQVFDRFFHSFSQSKYGKEIHDIIDKERDLGDIKNQIAQHPSFNNDSLIELLILKGLHDGYYRGDYDLKSVVHLLDTIKESSSIEEHTLIASNIISKITKLAPTYPAPDFELHDKDSTLISLENFKGKYVYLNFCSFKSITCQEDFELLNELHRQYKDKLAIVSVSRDENSEEFFRFMKKNKYAWHCLSVNRQPEIIKTYQAKVIPSYYLIDPYNKILLAPTLSPRKNFENEFHRILNRRN